MAKTTRGSIVEFGKDFQAKTGTVLQDASVLVNNILDPNAPKSSSTLVGKLRALSATPKEEDINTEILSKGAIKLGFPAAVRDFPEQVVDTLDTVLTALKTLKSILETIRDFITGASDLIKLLLSSIFSTLEDLINMFTSVDAKVRVLPISPIHPASIEANIYTGSEEAIARAFSTLITETYGNTKITKAYPSVPKEEIQEKLLGKTGPGAVYTDGSSGFLAAINDSFADVKDPNRPTESVGYSGGIVVQAGTPAASILEAWTMIQRILRGGLGRLGTSETEGTGPAAKILSAEHTGFTEDGEPISRLTIINPNHKTPKNFLNIPQVLYYPVEIEVLSVQNTDTSPYAAIREAGYQKLSIFRGLNTKSSVDTYSPYLTYLTPLPETEENMLLETLDPSGVTSFREPTSHINLVNEKSAYNLSTASAELRAVDVLYKARISFRKFTLENGSYIGSTYDATNPDFVSMSNTFPLHLPLDVNADALPVLAAGPAPNWMQYGKTWQIPGTQDIVRKLQELLDTLKAFISTTTNYLTAVVNTYIVLVEKLTMLVTRLSNIVFLIDQILNTSIGGNYFIFTSDSGATGIKKAINDHYASEKAAYTKAKAAGTPTTQYDWFADGESVCGVVVVATSQTAEQVQKLIELLRLLFEGESASDTSGQSVVGDVLLTKPTFVLEGTPVDTQSKPLFIDNFAGIDSASSGDSPEKACPND